MAVASKTFLSLTWPIFFFFKLSVFMAIVKSGGSDFYELDCVSLGASSFSKFNWKKTALISTAVF